MRELVVNGRRCPIESTPEDTPLLYFLRNHLALKGARFGCGGGECGACTVLVDGRPEHSCELPLWAVEGKAVRTIEGLGGAARLHPLQQAILDFQAGQCGYCLNGIIMRCAGLIESGAEPSRAAIIDALDGHLCRCGAHARILRAIEAAWTSVRRTRR